MTDCDDQGANYLPNEAEILRLTEKIRTRWSRQTYRTRDCRSTEPVEVQVVSRRIPGVGGRRRAKSEDD